MNIKIFDDRFEMWDKNNAICLLTWYYCSNVSKEDVLDVKSKLSSKNIDINEISKIQSVAVSLINQFQRGE